MEPVTGRSCQIHELSNPTIKPGTPVSKGIQTYFLRNNRAVFRFAIQASENTFQTLRRRGGRIIIDLFGILMVVHNCLELSFSFLRPAVQYPFKALDITEKQCLELVLLDIRNDPFRSDFWTLPEGLVTYGVFQFQPASASAITKAVKIDQCGEIIEIGIFIGQMPAESRNRHIATALLAWSCLEQRR